MLHENDSHFYNDGACFSGKSKRQMSHQFLSIKRQSIQRSDDMRDFIPVDPRDATVIDVGDLEHCVDPWITGTAFAENNLAHPPVDIYLVSNLLRCLNNHKVTSLDAQKRRRLDPLEWTDRLGEMINAH